MSDVTFTVETSKFGDDNKFLRIRRGQRFVCLNSKTLPKLLEKQCEIETCMTAENPESQVSFKLTLTPMLTIEVTCFKGCNYLSFRKNGGYLNLSYDDWKELYTTYSANVLSSKKRPSTPTNVVVEKKRKTASTHPAPTELARYVMLILVRRAVKTIAESSCDGCLEGYPSQNDHKCLNEAEYMHELYIEEAYTNAEKKFMFLLSKIIDKEGLSDEYLLGPEDVHYHTVRSGYFDEIPAQVEQIVEACIYSIGLRI